MLFWLIVIGGAILLEVGTVQLVGLPFVFGGIAALIVYLLHVDVTMQLIVFIVISILSLVLLQVYFKKKVVPKPTSTNLELLIGKELIVLEYDALTKKGSSKVNGVNWTIRSDEVCNINDIVYIKSIEGTTLVVGKEK